MNKEEILSKSREENKDKDLFEKEVAVTAGNACAITAAILATVFFIIQILVGEGMNYGLYAIVFSMPATGYIIKSVRLKRTREIVVAAIYTVTVILLSAAHILDLISSSTIL